MMTGQQRPQQQWTSHGQVQQTLRRARRSKRSTTTSMRKNIAMPEQQKASKHQSSQQHKSVLNMNSHTFPTGVGVQHVFKTKDEQTTTHDNTANNQSYNSTFVSSKHLEKRRQHQSSQALTWKQAWAWQFLSTARQQTFNITSNAYKHSSWSVAEYKLYSTAQSYSQIRRITS